MPVTFKLRDLGVLRARDMPEVEVILVEDPEPEGPFGAKGVGEIGLVPTAAAVAGALEAFDGIRRRTLPMKDSPAARAMSVGGATEAESAGEVADQDEPLGRGSGRSAASRALTCSSTPTRTSTAGSRRSGMPRAGRTAARTSSRSCRSVWWRLDRALDEPSLRAGAAATTWPTRCCAGTAALVDHHESPNFIEGSLDVLADACEELGVRGACCATARPSGTAGATKRGAASTECRRFILANRRPRVARRGRRCTPRSPCRTRRSREAGELCRDLGTVLHVHLAEDVADVEDARRRGYAGPLERLLALGRAAAGFDPRPRRAPDRRRGARARRTRGCWLVQNPRSNREEPGRLPVGARRGRARRARHRRLPGGHGGRGNGRWPSARRRPANRPTRSPARPGAGWALAAGATASVARTDRGWRGARARRRVDGRPSTPRRPGRQAARRLVTHGLRNRIRRSLMKRLGIEKHVVDRGTYENSVTRFRDARILLPTFTQLADPDKIPAAIHEALAVVDPDAPHPLNLFRVHWYNDSDRRHRVPTPDHVVLPASLTGVDAPIVVALGNRFPMIRAHKVLAAYGCLAPRIVTGQFDPTAHKAIWPSTGNYCRGGVAISRIMNCHGVAILPEGMSEERFRWLEAWVQRPGRHRADAGLREQRQGDLRRVRGARTRSAEHHLQPVLRVRQLPRALRLHRPRARADRRGDRPGGRHKVQAYVSATGSGGTLGGRRLPEGAVRRPHRRGRGAGVPDAALQRVRRAQHPGHRRQARPVHPQRDEHRPGRRGVRCRHRLRSACCSARRRAATTWWSAGACRRRSWRRSTGSGCRASATCWRPSRPRSTTASAPTTSC